MAKTRRTYFFAQVLRRSRKAYAEYGITMPYADFRLLLEVLNKRKRPDGVTLSWGLRNRRGEDMELRLHKPKDHVKMPLPLSEVLELAKRDPQELYAYLHTCTQLLLARRDDGE